MGQKVNPHGLSVEVIKDWEPKYYAEKEHEVSDFHDTKVKAKVRKHNFYFKK